MLQKFDWFLSFWNAVASGTIPAAGLESSGEVPIHGTVPVQLRRGNMFFTSGQGNTADLSLVYFWILCFWQWLQKGNAVV